MIALGVPRSLHCHLEALSSIPCLCSGWGSGQRLDGWCESWLPLICVSLCSDVVDSEIIPIILGHSISLMIRTKAAPFPLVSAPFHVCVISLSHLVICVIICAIILRYFSLNIRRLSFFGWRFLVPSKYIVWIKIWFYMLKAIHWYVYLKTRSVWSSPELIPGEFRCLDQGEWGRKFEEREFRHPCQELSLTHCHQPSVRRPWLPIVWKMISKCPKCQNRLSIAPSRYQNTSTYTLITNPLGH